MKTLVIGNLGYVGSVLTPTLVAAFGEDAITGFDTGWFRDMTYEHGVGYDPGEQIIGDIRDITTHDIFRGMDSVIYLAAVSNDPMSEQFAVATYEINTASAIRSAQLAREAGVKSFVFASSCSVYGAGGDNFLDESSPLNPVSNYARSKMHAEEGLRGIATDDFLITCLRFGTACGPSYRLRLDLVLNKFVADATTHNAISICGEGDLWRPLIDVRDMAQAILWAISRSSGGQDFLCVNVGRNDANYRVRQIAEVVVMDSYFGCKLTHSPSNADLRSYRVNFDLFHHLAHPFYWPTFGIRASQRSVWQQIRTAYPIPPTRLEHIRELVNWNTLTANLRPVRNAL